MKQHWVSSKDIGQRDVGDDGNSGVGARKSSDARLFVVAAFASAREKLVEMLLRLHMPLKKSMMVCEKVRELSMSVCELSE